MSIKDKTKRLETLRAIISCKAICTQEGLQQEMKRAGFDVTQATLSRDLHTIKAEKVTINDEFRYILSEHPLYRHKTRPAEVPEFLRRNTGFLSIDFTGNLAVIHTQPGYAAGLAADIDQEKIEAILGTVAGHDTLLVITRENTDRQALINQLAVVIPAIKTVLL